MEKISFLDPQTNENVELFVVEETKLNGETYLLVAEEEEGDSDAYIFKEVSSNGEENCYEMVEDEAELDAVSDIFSELLEDVDVTL
ncbi:MAG: DUF1292 domain-containing protein [Lachnospiraceae bacterium]